MSADITALHLLIGRAPLRLEHGHTKRCMPTDWDESELLVPAKLLCLDQWPGMLDSVGQCAAYSCGSLAWTYAQSDEIEYKDASYHTLLFRIFDSLDCREKSQMVQSC